VIVLLLASGAAGQDLLSVEVNPLRVELTLKPGATHTQAVTLKNVGPKAVRVRARVDDWHLSRDGTPQFESAAPDAPYSASAWLRLNPSEQVIAPGGSGIVRFTTTVPTGVKDAGYRCAVMFEFERPDAGPAVKTREVTFRGRVATLLYATVGSPKPSVELTDLQGRVLPNRAPEVVVTLKNTGMVQARTRGTAVVFDASGRTVRQLTVPNAPVLPESERELAIPTANEGEAPLAPGTYRIEVKLDLGMRELLVGETTLEVPVR
jgi:P pilus assembly chaperone PapD